MATNYSQYFNTAASNANPAGLTQETRYVPGGMGYSGGHQTRYTIGGQTQTAPVSNMSSEADKSLEAAMSGLDGRAAAYEADLKGIYDNFSAGIDQYAGNIDALIGKMDGDIDKLTGYIGDYEGVLSEIKPTMMDGIKVDPNAQHTRAEYMGSVAAQADQADASMRRQMASQGLNPYQNTGANRDMLLGRNLALAGASNQAYRDWHDQYNKDIQAKQAGMAQFAELSQMPADMYGDVVGARAGQIDAYGNLIDHTLDAQQSKAAGYEYLNNQNNDRRTEQLELAQNAQNSATALRLNEQQIASANLQTQASLIDSGKDQWRWGA